MKRLLLIRHCESTGQAPDAPLSERGHEQAQARGRAALEAALASGDTLPALVSHGQLLSLVLRSIDPAFGFEDWARLANPDVFVVEAENEGRLRFQRLALASRRMV